MAYPPAIHENEMEKLMQYVWQHRLWRPSVMTTTDGRRVQVLDPGLLNVNAGPDFFNAKVKIGDKTWAGNIEIHLRASDWYHHHHDQDPAYDSVILHVVDRDDTAVKRSNGEMIPQVSMPCHPDFHRRYHALVDNASSELPCAREIDTIAPLYLYDWIDNLAHQRLYDKTDRILSILDRTNGDWEETCYITLARALGFGINGDAFERLASSLPLRFMGKHSDSLLSIEALLFGQSGLITNNSDNAYCRQLKKEYAFLSHKFTLHPPECLGWRMARMRPQGFPHRRIALLAAMVHGGFKMMERILHVTQADDARRLFDIELQGYWSRHYSFNAVDAGRSIKALSQSSVNILTINAVVPLLHAYGERLNDNAMRERAIELLQSIPPERNSIVSLFEQSGIKCPDAFTSQAFVQLRRCYCEPRKCLYCRIGHRMLAKSATRL